MKIQFYIKVLVRQVERQVNFNDVNIFNDFYLFFNLATTTTTRTTSKLKIGNMFIKLLFFIEQQQQQLKQRVSFDFTN